MASCFWIVRPAAAEPQHGVQLGLDIAWHSVRDDTLVPIAFSGPRPGLEARYFGKLGEALLLGDARFGLGYVLDTAGARGATSSWGLHISYLPIIYHGNWRLALGPALGWDNERFWFGEWDDAHTYWIGTLWLGPGMRAWRWLSSHWRMDIGAELGLVGWQSRTPAGRRNKQETSDFSSLVTPATKDMAFGWLRDWQLVRASIELYRAGAHSDTPSGFGLGAEFGLTRAVDPVLAFGFNISLRVSYTWSL